MQGGDYMNPDRLTAPRVAANLSETLAQRFREDCIRERRAQAEVIRFLIEGWCEETECKRVIH